MKQLLVGGGVVDFATLHPLWSTLTLFVAVLVTRRAVRAFGLGRRVRTRRPPAPGGDGESRRPAAALARGVRRWA